MWSNPIYLSGTGIAVAAADDWRMGRRGGACSEIKVMPKEERDQMQGGQGEPARRSSLINAGKVMASKCRRRVGRAASFGIREAPRALEGPPEATRPGGLFAQIPPTAQRGCRSE